MLHHLDSDNVKKVVDTIMGMTVFLKVFCLLLMRQKKYWILQIIKDVIQNSSLLCYQKLEFFTDNDINIINNSNSNNSNE